MRFDGWNTIEGRHLVFIYATVILVQGGYFLAVGIQWFKLRDRQAISRADGIKNTTRPV